MKKKCNTKNGHEKMDSTSKMRGREIQKEKWGRGGTKKEKEEIRE